MESTGLRGDTTVLREVLRREAPPVAQGSLPPLNP